MSESIESLLNSRISQIHDILYKSIQQASDWQIDSRKLSVKWFLGLLFVLGYILSAQYQYLQIQQNLSIVLVCWAGIIALAPMMLLDVSHYQLMRIALKHDASTLENSFAWAAKIQSRIDIEKKNPIASSMNRLYFVILSILIAISGMASRESLRFYTEQYAYIATLAHLLPLALIYRFSKRRSSKNARISKSFKSTKFIECLSASEIEWQKQWPTYQLSLTLFNKFLGNIMEVRRMAFSTFMWSYSAIAVVMSTPDKHLAINRPSISLMICSIGAIILIYLWSVDMGYQKYIVAITQRQTEREKQCAWIPQFFNNIYKGLNEQKFSVPLSFYYSYLILLVSSAALSLIIYSHPVVPIRIFVPLTFGFTIVSLIFAYTSRYTYRETLLFPAKQSTEHK